MNRISAEDLRTLRTQVPMLGVIFHLQIPTELRGSRFTFRCPTCGNFHTALNPRSNVARCFGCRRNFNPIDLVMAERNWSFLQTVDYLRGFLLHPVVGSRVSPGRLIDTEDHQIS